MGERLVEMASKQNDVLFNLLSLKLKFLVRDQTCESCNQPVQEWYIHKVCHKILCEKCLEYAKNEITSFCPLCNSKFDSTEYDIISSNNMKNSFCQLQELVFSLLSLEKNTSDVLHIGNGSDVRIPKPAMIHVKSVKLKPTLKEASEVNYDELQLSSDLFDGDQNKLPMKTDNERLIKKKRTDESNCLNFNKNLKSIKKNIMGTEYEHNSVTNSSDELLFNNVATDSVKNNSQHCNLNNKPSSNNYSNTYILEDNAIHETTDISQIKTMTTVLKQHLETTSLDESQCNNMTTEYGSQDCDMSDEQQSSDYDSSTSDSDNNTVYGTPPNRSLLVSVSQNSCNRKDICLSYSNFNEDELNIIKTFYKVFKVRVNVFWSDQITHLVIKLNANGTYNRTRKYINAILSNCCIVTEEWLIKSIREKSIQPEQEYMPLDESGEASALLSWRIGQGILESTMLWTKKCILYFHSSVTTHEYFTAFKGWALKVGFMVIKQMEEFNSVESDLRIILTDFRIPEEEINTAIDSELMSWLKTYKAVTLQLDWYLEVLSRYRFILIEPYHQVLKLNYSMVELADLDKSMISIKHNN